MKTNDSGQARKRAVNLFLNEDLVTQARSMTDNLSAEVETLLTAYVQQHQQRRNSEAERLRRSAAAWNSYTDRQDSFADEFSTL